MAMTTDPRFAVGITARAFTVHGHALIEITCEKDAYLVQITSTGTESAYEMDLKKERRVLAEVRVSHKPLPDAITLWLQHQVHMSINVHKEVLEHMLTLLPEIAPAR